MISDVVRAAVDADSRQIPAAAEASLVAKAGVVRPEKRETEVTSCRTGTNSPPVFTVIVTSAFTARPPSAGLWAYRAVSADEKVDAVERSAAAKPDQCSVRYRALIRSFPAVGIPENGHRVETTTECERLTSPR